MNQEEIWKIDSYDIRAKLNLNWDKKVPSHSARSLFSSHQLLRGLKVSVIIVNH
jgi:hypothetical protein